MNDTIPLRIHDETAIPMDEAVELKKVFTDALGNYAQSGSMNPKEWSAAYFQAEFPDKSGAEIAEWADEIEVTLSEIEKKKISIAAAHKNGIGVDDWFAKDIQSMTAQMAAKEAAAYLSSLDAAVQNMTQTWKDATLTKCGDVSGSHNLDGFMAEAHHVNSFNADAAAKGSPYRAEVLRPGDHGYSKNSVDIVIKDANGKIVRRYQSKYGKTTEATGELFKHGDYRGQRKLAPEGQDVDGSVDHIEIEDVKSKPLSKQGAKRKQEEAQSSGKAPVENYNAFDTKVMLKNIGRDAAIAGAIGAGMNVAFDLGAKLARGENVELEDVAAAAVTGGGDAAVKTVAASAVKVAIEKDVWKATAPLKGTPLGAIVAAIDVGVSNVKTIFKVGDGELTLKEGIDEIEANTAAGVSGYLGAAKGAVIGAEVGVILGPVGAAVGGFIGGVVGGLAGSTVGRAIVKGVQAVRDFVWEGIKSVGETLGSIVESVFSEIGSFFSGWF